MRRMVDAGQKGVWGPSSGRFKSAVGRDALRVLAVAFDTASGNLSERRSC